MYGESFCILHLSKQSKTIRVIESCLLMVRSLCKWGQKITLIKTFFKINIFGKKPFNFHAFVQERENCQIILIFHQIYFTILPFKDSSSYLYLFYENLYGCRTLILSALTRPNRCTWCEKCMSNVFSLLNKVMSSLNSLCRVLVSLISNVHDNYHLWKAKWSRSRRQCMYFRNWVHIVFLVISENFI